jgi:putative DNA primase/helicase
MTVDLSHHIGDITRLILGSPNDQLSTRKQLRFGSNGSIAVEIDGPAVGSWFDHETGRGGGPWEFLAIKGGMANGEAVDWLKREFDIDAGGESFTARIVRSYDYEDERGRR